MPKYSKKKKSLNPKKKQIKKTNKKKTNKKKPNRKKHLQNSLNPQVGVITPTAKATAPIPPRTPRGTTRARVKDKAKLSVSGTHRNLDANVNATPRGNTRARAKLSVPIPPSIPRSTQLPRPIHERIKRAIARDTNYKKVKSIKKGDLKNKIKLVEDGNFGEIYKAVLKKPKEKVVILKTLKIDTPNILESFKKEVVTMSNLNKNDNVVKLLGIIEDQLEGYEIVIECCHRGDLRSYLKNPISYCYCCGITKPYLHFFKVADDIINGMKYIHSENYVHLDLAARNIFIDKDNVCKIGDFGLSKSLNSTDTSYLCSVDKFAIQWYYPGLNELITKTKKTPHTCQDILKKSDAWSFCCLLVEIIRMGANPYAQIPKEDILSIIIDWKNMGFLSNICGPNNAFKNNLNTFITQKLLSPIFVKKEETHLDFNNLHDIIRKNIKEAILIPDFEIKPHSERTEEIPLEGASFRDQQNEAPAIEEYEEEGSSPEFMPVEDGSGAAAAKEEKDDSPDYQVFQLIKTLTNPPAIYTTMEDLGTNA